MSVTLKQSAFKYKDPDTGDYIALDVVSDMAT